MQARTAVTIRRPVEAVDRYWRDPTGPPGMARLRARVDAVSFTPAPGGGGTEVRVELGHHRPGGALGRAVARLLGRDPHRRVTEDLRRLKQVLETGEVVRSEGSPQGARSARLLAQRPARPPA